MSMTMIGNKALDTTSSTSQRFVVDAVTALAPLRRASAPASGPFAVGRGQDLAQLELEKDVAFGRL